MLTRVHLVHLHNAQHGLPSASWQISAAQPMAYSTTQQQTQELCIATHEPNGTDVMLVLWQQLLPCLCAGQLVMGDATYNHIYNGTDSTGSVTQRLHPGAAPQAEEEEQDMTAPQAQEPRAGLLSLGPAADDNLDALHDAIVSNTDGSAAAIAAGTPTGTAPSVLMQMQALPLC